MSLFKGKKTSGSSFEMSHIQVYPTCITRTYTVIQSYSRKEVSPPTVAVNLSLIANLCTCVQTEKEKKFRARCNFFLTKKERERENRCELISILWSCLWNVTVFDPSLTLSVDHIRRQESIYCVKFLKKK